MEAQLRLKTLLYPEPNPKHITTGWRERQGHRFNLPEQARCRVGREKPTLAGVELSFIVHATEDEPKLVDAICKAFRVEPESLERSTAKGYFGNPIIYYRATIKKDRADLIFNDLLNRLPAKDLKNMLRRLEKYVDGQGHLYLRIDKQGLLLSRWLTGSQEPVRLKFTLNKWGANILDWKHILSESIEKREEPKRDQRHPDSKIREGMV
jgi:RNA binding exosome subunit